LIVPYWPGGGYDNYARAIARVMPKYLPKKVDIIVRNITGAGGMTALHTLFRAKPDGYTLSILSFHGMCLFAALGKADLDPTKLGYLGTVGRDPGSISVNIKSSFNTLADMQRAKRVKWGATGAPSGSWYVPKLTKPILNMSSEVVTGYRGSAGFITALIRGEVDAVYMGLYAVMPYIKAGELKPVVLFRESDLLPDVPVIQKGSPYEDLKLIGEERVVAGPPGIPKDIMAKLEIAFKKAIEDPQTQAWSKKTGYLMSYLPSKEVKALSKKLIEFYKKHKELLSF
jgi:tripartite-type tricarboxylate transporter receptor subunit TctC